MQLLPLCIEDLKQVPAAFGKVKMVKATADVFEPVASAVCKGVVSHLGGKEVDQNMQSLLKDDKVCIEYSVERKRQGKLKELKSKGCGSIFHPCVKAMGWWPSQIAQQRLPDVGPTSLKTLAQRENVL